MVSEAVGSGARHSGDWIFQPRRRRNDLYHEIHADRKSLAQLGIQEGSCDAYDFTILSNRPTTRGTISRSVHRRG
jgi:hypothetical protein